MNENRKNQKNDINELFRLIRILGFILISFGAIMIVRDNTPWGLVLIGFIISLVEIKKIYYKKK
ncbi:MAG TPA: hypothetical protein GXZ48_06655 [Acholeplasmataceae bacterium]|nr:hypothetical protein [Acholeplasmataceae bacterium]